MARPFYFACMNRKQRSTLLAVFAKPTSGTIAWADIESLFAAVGCRLIEGDGSRVRFEKNGVVAMFHRPHPTKEANHYQVRDARDYLTKIGVTP
jgi:HicA toxin of bacterial toxin-antitoxin,